MPVLAIRFSEKEYVRLAELAKERQIPVSTLARSILAQGLNQEESSTSRARIIIEALENDPQLTFRLRRLLLFPGVKGP